jgi:hypothetical protein
MNLIDSWTGWRLIFRVADFVCITIMLVAFWPLTVLQLGIVILCMAFYGATAQVEERYKIEGRV